MMTEQYIKAVAEGKARDMLQKQAEIASRHYNGGTGRLLASLHKNPVMQGGKMRIEYPLYIRFLDLSRSRSGKRKKGYHPIYNRYTYGYLFTGIYVRLMAGLSGAVRQTISRIFN